MNGKTYLLDTNTIIYAINGKLVFPEENYIVSIVTEMELLSYSGITQTEETNIKSLLSNFCIVNITDAVKEKTIEIRKKSNAKLPDSIICATAIATRAILITNDQKLHKIPEVTAMTLSDFSQKT